jgi:hypothetical protein
VDFATFYSAFGALFYLDNRKKYRLDSSKTDRAQLKKDLIKIVSSLGVGKIVYLVARWSLQYYFLAINYEPYLASLVAHLISTALYMIVVNVGVKIMRLYKDGT